MPTQLSPDEIRRLSRVLVTRADRMVFGAFTEDWYAANLRLSKELFHLSLLKTIPSNAIDALRADYRQLVLPFDKTGSAAFDACLQSLESPGQATAGCLGLDLDPKSFPNPAWFSYLVVPVAVPLTVLLRIALPRHGPISTFLPLWLAIIGLATVMIVGIIIHRWDKNRAAHRTVYLRCCQCGDKFPAGADHCATCGETDILRKDAKAT